MAMTNRDRVAKALDLLKAGLGSYVEREFAGRFGARKQAELQSYLGEDRLNSQKPPREWDAGVLLRVMFDSWNEVFKETLGPAERSLVGELRGWRYKWAHQEPFSTDDTYRVLDSCSRLLSAVSAAEAEELDRMRLELLRLRFDEQVRSEQRKAGGSLVEAAAAGRLKGWREVVTPHEDVASGRYQQAEFAADLWQVYLGEGSDEYRDPVEFFRRTYLTESLKRLLKGTIERFTGKGGDPVVQLQTNFGGGKTHSMLALYHLCSGKPLTALPGVEELLQDTGVNELPKVRRVVLVGNRISPGNPSVKPDGIQVRTLWGELAWQLGGRQAYERIRADDERATNPGDALRQLFKEYGPCLILIDEWVAYARQLHDTADLPGGTFDTQFSFAQALTESARAADGSLVVISLPASDAGGLPHAQMEDVEVGGIRGREALHRLKNVVGRVESSWRPATAEEGFEIVRRRLFKPMTDPQSFKDRDVTARAFAELYRQHRQDFPAGCNETDYERRIQAAYPIHPEVFDRLYEDWSTLVKFQRTRGVLRLMAAVIHSLWEKGDRNPLILPSTIPIDDPGVHVELTRYLSDNWTPIIDKDVDGTEALPVVIDRELPNLAKYQACRRVARTIFLGSAPKTGAAHRGIEDKQIKLGCVMPGESPNVFGDALRILSSKATYLYQDGTRYWFDVQPTVAKLAEDRAEQYKREPEKIHKVIQLRLQDELRERGDFAGVHLFPQSGADVPDDVETRLAVLGPEHPHVKDGESPALKLAREILETRGSAPRLRKNTLVFLAADKTRLQDLEDAVRRYLAWESIVQEKEVLNLSPFQVRQAEEQKRSAEQTVKSRLPETYFWVLVPSQNDLHAEVEWQSIRVAGQERLAVRASKKVRSDELLVTTLAGTALRLQMDRVPLWQGDHLEIRQLMEFFARYLYLPRLKSPAVLAAAIRDGVSLMTWAEETFAYADSYDEKTGRYLGLRAGQNVPVPDSCESGLVVRPEAALRQMKAAQPAVPGSAAAEAAGVTPVPTGAGAAAREASGTPVQPLVVERPKPRRFHGSVELQDALRVGRDAGRIAEEVLTHLAALPNAKVRVTLEIQAELPEGAPDHVVRTVTENCRTLKFSSQGFETD